MKQQTNYNQLVSKKDNAYYFCDYIFEDGDFRGATATVLAPVSKDEYEERTDPDNAEGRFEEIWQLAVQDDRTTENLAEFTESILNTDGDEAIFDFSGYDLWPQLREAIPELTEEDYPVFECIEGGRSFSPDMEWDEVYDEELWEKIKIVETE